MENLLTYDITKSQHSDILAVNFLLFGFACLSGNRNHNEHKERHNVHKPDWPAATVYPHLL